LCSITTKNDSHTYEEKGERSPQPLNTEGGRGERASGRVVRKDRSAVLPKLRYEKEGKRSICGGPQAGAAEVNLAKEERRNPSTY